MIRVYTTREFIDKMSTDRVGPYLVYNGDEGPNHAREVKFFFS